MFVTGSAIKIKQSSLVEPCSEIAVNVKEIGLKELSPMGGTSERVLSSVSTMFAWPNSQRMRCVVQYKKDSLPNGSIGRIRA